jgi:phage-related protein
MLDRVMFVGLADHRFARAERTGDIQRRNAVLHQRRAGVLEHMRSYLWTEPGHLRRVQQGLDPERWKTVRADRLSVQEIRITAAAGEFRVIYVANRPEAIYVLHAFHKKSQKMPQRDYRVIGSRIHTLLLRE